LRDDSIRSRTALDEIDPDETHARAGAVARHRAESHSRAGWPQRPVRILVLVAGGSVDIAMGTQVVKVGRIKID
jgi:hypothetical protein